MFKNKGRWEILIVDMVYLNELNKTEKPAGKMELIICLIYSQLFFGDNLPMWQQ